MASIGTITLAISTDVANAIIKVTYSLTGSAFDIASGQPYAEVCKLIGDDTGLSGEDNVDDPISSGVLTGLFGSTVVFTNSSPITHSFTKTIPRANLNEDAGTDEIRAVVTLTPILASKVTKESNMVTGSF